MTDLEHMKAALQKERLLKLVTAVCNGYPYNPGDSDLDNVQPIHVRMTLGDYRKAVQLWHELAPVGAKR
jgi:hypothetical protein